MSQHSSPAPGPSWNPSQVATLPEKAEKEIMVSRGLYLVKATTLNLGQRDRTFCSEGTNKEGEAPPKKLSH